LYKTTNRGDSWIRISPDLTTDDPSKLKQEKSGGLTVDNSSAENHCTIYTINESPLDSSIIWAGTDDGNLQVTADGGKTWFNTVKNIPGLPPNTWCSYVEPDRFDRNTVFATFDGHRMGDKKPYVYVSRDLGKTWKSISDTVIKTYCHVIRQDIVKPGLLFLGTEAGIYVSVNGGENWSYFRGSMPKVPVMDMCIHPREQSLVIATHGRGIMIIDDLSPFRQITEDILNKDVSFLNPKDFIIREGSTTQEFNGDDEFIGQVPPSSVPIMYYLKKRHVFGDIHLEIYDDQGKMIKKLPAGMRKGVNVVQWNFIMKPPKVPVSPQIEGYTMVGPDYAPGTYKVKLFKNKDVFETSLKLLPDPHSLYSAKDRETRFNAIMKAYNLLESLAFTDRQAREARDQARKLAPETGGKLSKSLLSVAARLDSLHGKIVSVKEGKITGEERLREKIGFIYGSMMAYPGKPTESQIMGLDMLVKDAGLVQEKVASIVNTEIPALNKELIKKQKPEIRLTSKDAFFAEP
jgi:photosystem II stability/assembly factor-like uncharacterized protein